MKKAILGIKQDMTQIYDEESKAVIPCTILVASDCVVAGVKTKEKDGYTAVVLGLGRKNKATKSEVGKFSVLGYTPRYVKEVRVDSTEGYEIGQKIDYSDIEIGTKVTAQGITKGKGFQGVVKRYGFAGGPKTHGQSDRWRALGSIGTMTGNVYKGRKMPGRMGNDTLTVNTEVVKVDTKNGLVVVKGSVPGARNGLLLVVIR